MTEEQQPTEKKKANLAPRILKWTGLAVLSLLLLIALVFQAPLKVTTLLLILLLACTVLPKAYRKYFWAGIGAVVIILIIWVFLPENNEDWKPFTFDEEITAYKAKFAVPDKENAALVYKQIFDNYDANVFEPNFADEETYYDLLSHSWSSKDYPKAVEWLKEQESTINTLLEASKIDKCSFPIATNIFEFGTSMKHFTKMRHLAHFLIIAGNNDIGENRIEAGLEKYNCVTTMGKHLSQQPTNLDFLVATAVEQLAMEQLKEIVILNNAEETYLRRIEKTIESIEHKWNLDLPKFIENEKIMTKTFLSLFYEINQKGKIRFIRDYTKALQKRYPNKEIPAFIYHYKKLFKLWTIPAWFYLPNTPQKAAQIIDKRFKKCYLMADPNFEWNKKQSRQIPFIIRMDYFRICFDFFYFIESLTKTKENMYYRIHDLLYLRTLAAKRGCLLLVALQRYKNAEGDWPENLEQLKDYTNAENFVDPINSGSFVYKLTDDNFTLYSKSKNNIDENDEYEAKWDPNIFEHEIVKDDRLIWPIESCETQEENNNDG